MFEASIIDDVSNAIGDVFHWFQTLGSGRLRPDPHPAHHPGDHHDPGQPKSLACATRGVIRSAAVPFSLI